MTQEISREANVVRGEKFMSRQNEAGATAKQMEGYIFLFTDNKFNSLFITVHLPHSLILFCNEWTEKEKKMIKTYQVSSSL